MNLELTDEQAAALEGELRNIIDRPISLLAAYPHPARDSGQDPARAETRTAPRAEALRAAAWRTIPQTRLDEIRTRSTDDPPPVCVAKGLN